MQVTPPIAAAAVYLRYKRTDRRIAPRPLTDILLWVTAAGMSASGVSGRTFIVTHSLIPFL